MPFPGNCPICNTLLAFQEAATETPVRCPVCHTRFVQQGRNLAHISFVDYYKLLGISPKTGMGEVRKVIRAKILEHHPDRNPDDPHATDRLRDIVKAKEFLTNDRKRREYDEIYFARQLPVWTKASAGPGGGGRRYDHTEAGVRSGSTSRGGYVGIDHLVEEIEDLGGRQKRSGFVFPGPSLRAAEYIRVRTVWVRAGILIGILAGVVFGTIQGTFIASLLLGIFGGIIGGLIAYYPSGLVVLTFFVARMFIAIFFIAILISGLAAGVWFPDGLWSALRVIYASTMIGSSGFGLWAIGTSTLQGRSPFIVNLVVLHMAAIGAWVGALYFMFISLITLVNPTPLHPILGWWFLAFTGWLILDSLAFGRMWIFVRE